MQRTVPQKNLVQYLLSLAVVFLSCVPAYAFPKMQVLNPLHDFDVVSEGQAIEHDYQIRNLGDSTLEIRKILPACGCTAAVVSSEKIEPGETTALKVRFDTNGFRGYKVKTIRVYTNDPEQSSVVLTMQGTVQPAIVVEPPSLHFGAIRRGESPAKELRILNGEAGAKIVSVRPRSEFVTVEKSEAGGVTTLRVTLDEKAPIGIFRSRIAVRTDSAKLPLINIPVFAKIRGDLALSSAAVSFGLIEGENASPVSRSIEIVNSSSKQIAILSAQSDHPNISVEVVPLNLGEKYRLDVRFSGSFTGALRARIKVTTDHEDPAQKELSIPVYGIVSRSST